MRVSFVSLLLAACTANGFSFKKNALKQDLFADSVLLDSEPDHGAFAEAHRLFASEPLPVVKQIADAWKDLENQYSKKELVELIAKYRNKASARSTFASSSPQTTLKPDEFEIFSSLDFESYSLRVKENHPETLGIDNVKQYTGYLDVLGLDKHFFYWFFELRNDPENDPVILWLNGGPGCSSLTGLFFELGPSLINATLQPVHNPFSWNNNALIIFLDQPVGVGYSYTGGEDVKNTATAAKDVFVFLELFFQKFSKFASNDFHIAGESYAGHYIPQFAVEIIEHADRSFNLLSVLIGNGITDSLIQSASYKPMGCGEGGYKPVLTEKQCDQMERDYPKCAALNRACYEIPLALTCVPATIYCEERLFGPYQETGLNPYDIRRTCDNEGGECYTEALYGEDFLNLDYVKEAVGASNIDIFLSCDETVFRNFLADGDESKPFQPLVKKLVEKGIPVLIYAGDKDYICNWVGNKMWVEALDYKHHNEFASAPMKAWYTAYGEKAGEVKNYENFTFLRVYDAGHMVPHDQPEASLDMVNRWIAGDYAFNFHNKAE